MDGRSVALHENKELIQEQLLLWMGEPAALTSDLHTAHHVLLQEEEKKKEDCLSQSTFQQFFVKVLLRQTFLNNFPYFQRNVVKVELVQYQTL